jgi:geranylgeranylglycerol-phosphate geranylgeranyltransferase
VSDVRSFAWAYLKTMRLYYSFITGIAGWIGVSFYFHLKADRYHLPITHEDYLIGGVVLGILFLSWGVNQIFNDWLGLPEDRVNAPNRPMVTGELNVRWALTLSGSLMAVAAVVSAILNPWALIPLGAGFLLNFVYNYSKAWGMWANVVFGIMIANCTVYGFLAVGPIFDEPFFTSNRLTVVGLVALMNGLMTYFTYFKDYEGDKAAGKRTFIVRHGLATARIVGVIGTFLPTVLFFASRAAGLFPFEITEHFVYCGVMTIFLQFWTAVRFYRNPIGPRAYFSNATNFRACACGQVTMIAIFNGPLALYLFSFTYVFIGFLFGLHDDVQG